MSESADSMLVKIPLNVSVPMALAKLKTQAATMGDRAFAQWFAREIIARIEPQHIIPAVYATYRAVVRDGLEFFLSQVSRPRLIALATRQLALGIGASPQERLVELAKCFPTLHKLGQLIARNPHLDPSVKKWLIQLENGIYDTPADDVRERIDHELRLTGACDRVQVQPSVLAEASVGAVVQLNWYPPECPEPTQGVGKVLKPGIREQLEEELMILAKTATFFETNRSHYPFRDLRFLEIFQEVRQMLANEINLAAEQTYLLEAAAFFADMEGIQIPELLPISTDALTAMTYLPGPKITEAALNPHQRERLASVLFEALVCRPLFGGTATTLFHGDPHAGNLLAVEDPASGRIGVGLLDWTLAGHLTRDQRIRTVQLIQAVIKSDLGSVRRAVEALALGRDGKAPKERQKFRQLVLGLMHSSAFTHLTRIKQTFKLLEELAYEGYVFPSDLMLFRKAIFTLEGVIDDLCPAFDMDAAVTRYLAGLVAEEIPARLSNLFFPLADKPENYPSLISNFELQSLLVHQYLHAVGGSYRMLGAYFWEWQRFCRTT